MPTELTLSIALKRAGWKVKIQEKEIREPPHVSILRRTRKWRINLRTGEFKDRQPNPSEVPEDLLKAIKSNWVWLCQQWENKYPDNPISNDEDRNDGNKHDSIDAT